MGSPELCQASGLLVPFWSRYGLAISTGSLAANESQQRAFQVPMGQIGQGYATALTLAQTNMTKEGIFDFDCVIRKLGVRFTNALTIFKNRPDYMEVALHQIMLVFYKGTNPLYLGSIADFYMGPTIRSGVAYLAPAGGQGYEALGAVGDLADPGGRPIPPITLAKGTKFGVALSNPATLTLGAASVTLETEIRIAIEPGSDWQPGGPSCAIG